MKQNKHKTRSTGKPYSFFIFQASALFWVLKIGGKQNHKYDIRLFQYVDI